MPSPPTPLKPSKLPKSLLLLTGELKELSQMLKIKDNVDHAGLSLPPEEWKELWLSKD
jgi:hypothetical protein